jgi:tetratricopeptide (TPR) repeat protein
VKRREIVALAMVLVAAVVGSYLPALEAGFIWNDDTYVSQNPTLDGVDGLRKIWLEPKSNEQYYPLVFSSFWLEKRLWGLDSFGYHLVNVLLHAGGALLLWAFLARLGLPAAWLAAAAFALHPVSVESVAWISERKNTLSLVFSLISAHAWLSWRTAAEPRIVPPPKKGRRAVDPGRRPQPAVFYAVALLAFVLALASKTTASVVPAVLLVLVWWKDGRAKRSDVQPLLPFFAAGVAFALCTAWLERTLVGAVGVEWALGPAGRLVLAGRTVAFYAGKIGLPVDLAFIYPRWTIDAASPVQWIPTVAAVAALAVAWALRRRLGRGSLAALLLFGGVLFPAMGFFNVYAMQFSYVADHFAYQAVAVASAAVVCGTASFLPATPVTRRVAGGLGLAVLAVLSVLTYRQSRVYRDNETLWRDTLAKNPDCFLCHTNYGVYLRGIGRVEEAEQHFRESLRIRPDVVPTLLHLAWIEEERGRLDVAAAHLESARKADPGDPLVRLNLGVVLTKAGRREEAIVEFRQALRLPLPKPHLAHNGLGVALLELGRPAEAIEEFRRAVMLRPDYDPARVNLERALAAVGARR